MITLGIALVVVFCVVSALIAFNVLPGVALDKIQQAQIFYSKIPAGSGFSLSLEPPPNRVFSSDNVALELIVTNTSEYPITLSEFSTSGCLSLKIDLKLPMEILPRHSESRSVVLRPACRSGQFQLTMAFAWEESRLKAHYDGFAATSPITVVSKLDDGMPRFFSIVSGVLRNFSWPLLLLLVGYLLQLRLAERDKKLKEEQNARESRSLILNTVLPEYSKLVQEHYLAICRRLDAAAEKPKTLERALCALILMRARILKLVNGKGGVYFVSIVAERLFGKSVTMFMGQCHEHLGLEEFDEVVESIPADDTIPAALKKCRQNKVFTDTLMPKFKKWADPGGSEFEKCLQLLRIASTVMQFECDRPLYQVGRVNSTVERDHIQPQSEGNWYVDPPTLEIDPEWYNVPEFARKEMFELVRQWLDGIPEECRKGVDPVPQGEVTQVIE